MNLTRAEAHERTELLTVSSYDIALDLTSSTTTFRSTTTIRFDLNEGTTPSATFVDLVAPTVHSIDFNGTSLDPADVYDGTRIALPVIAASNVLTVVADCAYMNTGEGLHRFVDPVDDEIYLYSQFEVADSRRVFAVFEQPSLKAEFTFTVTAPTHWRVFSNEAVDHIETAKDTLTHHFATTPRISSYITAIVAGPYKGSTGSLVSSDGRTIPLGVYCRASLHDYLEAEEVMDITTTGFEFFEREFDTPYPFTKYDQIFVPEFNAGAMENAGCVTHTETYVFRSKVPEATVERRAVTILHELAHMWFGDLVTMTWWDDLWLNESFAEFMSTLCAAEATRWSSTAWTTFSSLEKSWAYRQDQLPSTHPIVADMRDLEDVEVNFDGITYAKGASVLRQLVAYVGRDAFFTGVRTYFHTHAWNNTTLTDFLTQLENASGRDLTTWATQWLQTAEVNTLRPAIETDEHGVVALTIEQSAPADYPTLRPHRLVVSGYTRDTAGRMIRTTRSEIDIDGPSTPVPAFLGQPRPDVLLINDEDLAYAKIRLDDQSLAAAKAHLQTFDDSLVRTLIWAATWDMTRDGEWAARDYVELVLDNIAKESLDSTVILVLLRQLATAIDLYVAPDDRHTIKAGAADRLLALALEAAAGSDAQLQFLKAFAFHASTGIQYDQLAEFASGARELPGLTIDTDLRWDLVTALVAADRAGHHEIDANLAKDRTATGERAAALARAALPHKHAKAKAWASVVESDELPNALLTGTIAGIMRTSDSGLLSPMLERYFAALPTVWRDRTSETAQSIVTGLYPIALAGVDDRLIDATVAFLDEIDDETPALRRLITENLSAARRAIAAQDRDRNRG